MNKKYIVDASAVLALLYQENTVKNLEKYFENAMIHIVNLCEVLAVLQVKGMPQAMAEEIVQKTVPELISGNYQEACLAASIRANNKQYGISTGDSFCLAAGILRKHPILTADKIWKKLDLNVEIIFIRD